MSGEYLAMQVGRVAAALPMPGAGLEARLAAEYAAARRLSARALAAGVKAERQGDFGAARNWRREATEHSRRADRLLEQAASYGFGGWGQGDER